MQKYSKTQILLEKFVILGMLWRVSHELLYYDVLTWNTRPFPVRYLKYPIGLLMGAINTGTLILSHGTLGEGLRYLIIKNVVHFICTFSLKRSLIYSKNFMKIFMSDLVT